MSRITNKFIDATGSTAGQVLASNGSGVAPSFQNLSASSAFVGYASSQVTTTSSTITSTSFVTFSNSPALTFTPTISGSYKVYSNATISSSPGASDVIIRIFNTSGSATLLQESQSLSDVGVGGAETTPYVQSVYTLTAGVTYVFDIQGKVGAGSAILDGSIASFYMFAEGIALSTVASLQFYASSQITTNSSIITSTSFTTFSNSPAFTFTPTTTGTYKVYSDVPLEQDTTGDVGIIKIFETSALAPAPFESQAAIDSTAAIIITASTQSVYTLTAGTTYTFDIQGRNTSTGQLSTRGDLAAFYMFAELCG